MKNNKQILERIDSIKWFAQCGTPITKMSINPKIIQVNSWEQAQKWYSDVNWENTTLKARNTLTEFLHNRHPNKYMEWNNTVRDAKEYIESSLTAKLQDYREQHNLDTIFVDCVKWDILNAIMEYAYSDCKKLPAFFMELLLVYENGNFPCGWNGEYPSNGELVIY